MIETLVSHHVAVTSTLSILESFVPNRPPMSFLMREQSSMMAEAWAGVLATRSTIAERASTICHRDNMFAFPSATPARG